MNKLNGAQILVESLIKEGVEVIFGYQGGSVLPIFDVLYDAPIKFIMVRHEQGAAHAADGYARSTGKVGVCLATSGPGATNLVTGIATAYMDSIPMVALTGQVPTPMIGNDAFQEADIVGITRPITKHNYLVKKPSDLAHTVKEAFHIASTGRPGPVLIDLPKDVSTGIAEYKYPDKIEIRSYNPTYCGHPGQIKKSAELISEAKKPVIYAGGGVLTSGASRELIELAEKTSIPVTTTLMGLGGFPATHPLFLGMLGMHGTKYANFAMVETDLIIAIGARFDDRITGKLDEFATNSTIIHIDIDPASISKNVKAHLPIVGDVRCVLTELNKIAQPPEITSWLKKINEWKENHPLTYKKGDGCLRPQFIIEEIGKVTQGKAIITTEVGQNQMWAAQYYKCDYPRHFLSSGGLGTMGYGFPAAIGAQVGNPDKIVFDIAGDGSIQMNIQELMTAVQYKLPVNVAILNNQYLGMVRQWQELFYNKRYAHTSLAMSPDFVKLAEAYGAKGIRVTEEKDVRQALEQAIASPKPVLIDFRIVEEENVFPMVPAGAALTQMIDSLA
ncbi:MAG: biosynthetic-type acetolactate synthase large subunit [bacterium]|nr:biosynthetic-type acetolactate synthase large subunit [bacterium]